jgi:hypothetical protein
MYCEKCKYCANNYFDCIQAPIEDKVLGLDGVIANTSLAPKF